MNRDNAERVFRLVAELRGDVHDRLVPDRWWLVWTLMGFEILITNTLTQLLLNRGVVQAWVHFSIFISQVLALAATIRIAQRKSGGHRSQIDRFIWWIWTTFLLAAAVSVGLNGLLGLPSFRTAPTLPLLAGFAFSIMGMIGHRIFLAASVIFVFCALTMAAMPHLQFYLYGIAWFVVLETLGYLHHPQTAVAGKVL